MQLNSMGKDSPKMLNKVEADKTVTKINKMLSDAGVDGKARAFQSPDEVGNYWKVDMPNLTLKMEYQKGGFKSKYQSKGFTIKREEGDEHIRDVDISGVDFNLLYDAIEQHEHRGAIDAKNYDSFIRTKSKKGKGSSAYGPIQLTHGKLLDLTTPGKRAYYDVENVDPTFHNIMVQQGSDMLEFGGSDMPKEGVTEDGRDVSMYDYGQPGIMGNTTRDREKYKRMGIQILEGDYRFAVKNPKKDVNTLHQMLKAYGTGTNKYAKDVLKIYNELKANAFYNSFSDPLPPRPDIPVLSQEEFKF
jgi:hypothetical protein